MCSVLLRFAPHLCLLKLMSIALSSQVKYFSEAPSEFLDNEVPNVAYGGTLDCSTKTAVIQLFVSLRKLNSIRAERVHLFN